uniref:F-box/LRR-repeat protein 15-like leucin rich repeat domain-containing protein n=1 Tax=Plectus sambesii TaxID=2011161 RepID=A0A914X9B8_9BILA
MKDHRRLSSHTVWEVQIAVAAAGDAPPDRRSCRDFVASRAAVQAASLGFFTGAALLRTIEQEARAQRLTQMKSLFNICLSFVSQQPRLIESLAELPTECKQLLLEWLCSHDLLSDDHSTRLMALPNFGRNLTRLSFYLSEELTDDTLIALANNSHQLEQITIIHCPQVSDVGVLSVTRGQRQLMKLELRSIRKLTSAGLDNVCSPYLTTVDLSGCAQIDSEGIVQLVSINRGIRCLYLNYCKAVDDVALYAIGSYLGENLAVLELDFLPNLSDPPTTLYHLSLSCPNIQTLSLCRYFGNSDNELDQLDEYRIDGLGLRDLDLYGNYFFTLPRIPSTVTSIRLSCCGDEDVNDLIRRLRSQRFLTSIRLQLSCTESDSRSVEVANGFLIALLPNIGSKITRLQISLPRLTDHALLLICESCVNLKHLAFDVKFMSTALLQRYFCGGVKSRASSLRSLKLCRLRVTYRVLFAIARGACSLEEIEMSHIAGVDDRFLSLLADTCPNLRSVNFNGCPWVTDKGMSMLARRCPLREVRIRATAVTDKAVYVLAQFCPDLEWIAHADFSGRPKFSDAALQCLRASCVKRVIC